MPTVILGAWGLVVGHHSGTMEDVAFGTRSIKDTLEPAIARIPVRVQIPRDQSVDKFLQQLQLEQWMSWPTMSIAGLPVRFRTCW
ncbi:amino acid adenylation [Apiospora marii]|uniref:Amino acid adenylation n=1 Tax=Apiospora marii TaxID=335849 RepID=A0ABR1RUD4_9PEZI